MTATSSAWTIPLKDVPDILRRKFDRKACYETVRLWTVIGLRGVILETKFIGREKRTSEDAIVRFVDGYTNKRAPTLPGTVDLTASEAAKREALELIGQAP